MFRKNTFSIHKIRASHIWTFNQSRQTLWCMRCGIMFFGRFDSADAWPKKQIPININMRAKCLCLCFNVFHKHCIREKEEDVYTTNGWDTKKKKRKTCMVRHRVNERSKGARWTTAKTNPTTHKNVRVLETHALQSAVHTIDLKAIPSSIYYMGHYFIAPRSPYALDKIIRCDAMRCDLIRVLLHQAWFCFCVVWFRRRPYECTRVHYVRVYWVD